ncbi:MAG: DsbA family oxidoreductase [Alphaproteobacteria bacterium]|nr:DsbA family oxidoreductase [Alphaproteobacteria bacterium]MBV9692226.1 DsbA family oxidoreductase [Alphaproteobacteria bacterium]
MQIDVVSDTVCPWCFIGKRRLARALELRPEIEFDVRWRPFRLDPTVPREGVDRAQYMRAKFGGGPKVQAMAEAIRAQGAAEGIAFDFARIERRPDTLDSHRLIRWAAAQGLQDTIVERLFAAYFEEGRDIGDPAVLEFLAADAGMDSIQVAELLADDTDRAAVEREAKLASEMGITGVPTFIFANKFVLSGAREPEVLAQVIDKAVEAETEEPADSP